MKHILLCVQCPIVQATDIYKQHVEEHNTGPSYGVKPLSRSDKPCYLGNLKKSPCFESSDFMNTGEGENEIVEEQRYFSNIISDAEIRTEREMGMKNGVPPMVS